MRPPFVKPPISKSAAERNVTTALILVLSAWAAGTGLRMIVQFLSGYPVYVIVWQDVVFDWAVMLFAGMSLTLSVLGSRHRHDERHHDED